MARLGTRRSPWTRRRDRWIAVSIAGSVCIAGLLVWASSDSASTRQATATAPSPTLEQPREVPESFTELWRASSPSTSTPVAVNGTAVTGEDGAVTGRDARSGAQRWHYARELELCAISGQWDSVTVMHRSSGWCSEVTQLNADTGERTAQRNGNAESGAELIGDGSHLVATGSHLLNVWSEDLVRTMEYGDVPTIINPGNQPRPDCEHSSAAVASGHIAVIERCPDEGADRLSVLTTTNHIEDEARDDEPDVTFSRLLDGGQARIVALSEDRKSVV